MNPVHAYRAYVKELKEQHENVKPLRFSEWWANYNK